MSHDDSKRLVKTYGESGVVLCVGAGVSSASGIPDWRELLRRIGQRLIPDQGVSVVDDLVQRGFSLPAIASILEAHYEKSGHRRGFAELIREALYRDLSLVSPKPTRDEKRQFVARIRNNNPTLRAIAAFCAIRKSQASYTSNPRVRAVINLNYDALLRTYMRYRYHALLLRTIERPDASPKRDRIPVYHPHGFLHFNRKYSGDLDSETPDQLILTEQEYFDFFNRPLSVFTYTMLFLLREHSFLFIGASLKDDNIRRLLHYSREERVAGFRRRGKNPDGSRANRHFVILLREKSAAARNFTEVSLGRLGVRVLWIQSFDQIPEMLRLVYESTREVRWEAVYD